MSHCNIVHLVLVLYIQEKVTRTSITAYLYMHVFCRAGQVRKLVRKSAIADLRKKLRTLAI